jgi:galactokinase/mevalonate kinase-like predicted kinase
VPKGSGLGTSSILAATVLGVLNNLCGLGWDLHQVCRRTLALEQMLTTGGGWQDQYGGILRGIKLLRTSSGFEQTATVSWLPEHLFHDPVRRQTLVLLYTGVTRVAKDILSEIVRGMFLNEGDRLRILEELGQHANHLAELLQTGDWDGFGRGIRRTWELNQALDPDTNPPAVRAILEPVQDFLGGCKLLGAGGGGYLLMIAKDEVAAMRIRKILTKNPPNARARIVEPSLSVHGLQVTRS